MEWLWESLAVCLGVCIASTGTAVLVWPVAFALGLARGANGPAGKCRASFTCGNFAEPETGICKWHAATMQRKQHKLGIEPHPTPNRRTRPKASA
jgi:hypothetical protein